MHHPYKLSKIYNFALRLKAAGLNLDGPLRYVHVYSLNSGFPFDNGKRLMRYLENFGWISFKDLSLFAMPVCLVLYVDGLVVDILSRYMYAMHAYVNVCICVSV